MYKLIVILLSLALLATDGKAVEIFFSPGPECEDRISLAIQSARLEIFAAVYVINNERILDNLVAAHKRGVKVKILTDRSQASGAVSSLKRLLGAGIDVRVHSRHQLEHNTFGVFDERMAVNGSYNWTKLASQNSENCAFMSEENAILAFKQRFADLWTLNKESDSQAEVLKIIAKSARGAESRN